MNADRYLVVETIRSGKPLPTAIPQDIAATTPTTGA
jgi:hypothetical protein